MRLICFLGFFFIIFIKIIIRKDTKEINENGEEIDITWKQYLEKVTNEAIELKQQKEVEKK